MLRVILTIVQVFSCFAIIGLVLLQRGKGAEAGAGFGAGASGTVFGARGAGTALSRATAIFVAIFMINSLLLTYMLGVTTTPAPAATGGSAATVPTPSAPADNGSVAPTPAPTTPVPAAPAAATAPASPASQPAPPPK
jgi:preprotein translocase subunit SecG